MLRADADNARRKWAYALSSIAREQGKDSALYKMLGSVAWGRYDHESSPNESKDNILLGLGFLEGVRYAAMRAGEQFDVPGWYDLQRIHDRLK